MAKKDPRHAEGFYFYFEHIKLLVLDRKSHALVTVESNLQTSQYKRMISMTPPIVVTIGGPLGAGKTTLCFALARRLNSLAMTLDDIVVAARAITTPESHPGLHLTNNTPAADYFTNSHPDKLISDAKIQQETIWPGMERVIRLRAKGTKTMVIDGWFLRPSQIAGLGLDNVLPFWLNVDPVVLEARERELSAELGESTDHEKMLQNFLKRSFWHNDLICREAKKFGQTVLYQNGDSSVDDLCEIALERIAAHSQFTGS